MPEMPGRAAAKFGLGVATRRFPLKGWTAVDRRVAHACVERCSASFLLPWHLGRKLAEVGLLVKLSYKAKAA
jgi:hypothetical protein